LIVRLTELEILIVFCPIFDIDLPNIK